MLRRLLLVAALLVAIAAGGHAAAQSEPPGQGERVIVTPGDGTMQTRFVFAGSGYQPGRLVSVRVTPPDGVQRRLTGDGGAELIWLTAADGSFAVEFVPAVRFAGARAGRWQALFCADISPTCQLVEFDVAP